jgi:hypothetical protein
MGRATPASQPPRPPACLKPGEEDQAIEPCDVTPFGDDLLADAEAAVLAEPGWLSSRERDEARRAAESLARRLEDQAQVNALWAGGFTGPAYELLEGELAAYGYPVILAWIRRGTIWGHCARRGRKVGSTDAEREVLERDFDVRLQLALDTVVETLPFFRDRVLREGRWSFDGGATLRTYFIGACILTFPNVFRSWQRAEHKWKRSLGAGMLASPEGRTLADLPGSDPAVVTAGRSAVISELRSMPYGTRDAAALVIDGVSFAETAIILDVTERAVEGRLYRYRQQRRTP